MKKSNKSILSSLPSKGKGQGDLIEGIDGLLPVEGLAGGEKVVDEIGKATAEEGGKKVVVGVDVDDLGIDIGNLHRRLPAEALEGPEEGLRLVMEEDIPPLKKGIIEEIDDGRGIEAVDFAVFRSFGNGLLHLLDAGMEVFPIALKESLKKGGFVGEVVVERVLADKGPIGDVLDGDVIEALLGKKRLQGIDQVPSASLDTDVVDVGIDPHGKSSLNNGLNITMVVTYWTNVLYLDFCLKSSFHKKRPVLPPFPVFRERRKRQTEKGKRIPIPRP